MWNTSEGIRKITGKEKELLKFGVEDMLFFLDDSDYGLAIFDRMISERRRRYAILDVYDRLTNDSPSRPIKAWEEEIIYLIFRGLEEAIDSEFDYIEIDEVKDIKDTSGIRDAIQGAWDELDLSEEEEGREGPPDLTDRQEWKDRIEILLEGILHDRDFLMADKFVNRDLDFDVAEEVMEKLGIDNDYFIVIPPTFDISDEKKLDKVIKGTNE